MIREIFKELWQKKFWYTLMIDIALFFSIFVFGVLTRFFIENISSKFDMIANMLFLVVYILCLIAIYSPMKYWILRIISGKPNKIKLKKFYLFNLTVLGVLSFIIIIVYSIIRYLIKAEYHSAYFAVSLALILVVGYALVNIMQILKALGKKNLERATLILKNNIFRIAFIATLEIIGIVCLYLAYVSAYYLTGGRFYLNPIFQISALLLILLYNAFNRIMFFKYTNSNTNFMRN